jgi:hypothetical protein
MSRFRKEDCYLPTVWCGESNSLPKKSKGDTYYYKVGSRYECLKQGFGAGSASERKNSLPSNSLEQIKYIGETHDSSFKKEGIKNVDQLVREMSTKSASGIEGFLKRVLSKSNGVVDMRAYNSVLLYLYRHGNGNLPACKKIKV